MKGKSVKIIKIIFLLGLFISPFIFYYPAIVPFELPKVTFTLRWIEFLGLFAVILIPFSKRDKINSKLLALLLLFFIVSFISSLYSVDFIKSFWGNYYRSDGLFTLAHLISLSIILALYSDKSWLKPFMFTMAISCVLLGIWVFTYAILLNIFHIPSIPNWGGVFGISFGNPNLLAGYLSINLPFTYFFIHRSSHKYLWLLALTIHISAIILTFSWSGIFMIIIFFLLIGLFLEKSKKTYLKYLSSMAILAFLATIFIYISYYTKLAKQWRFLPDSRQRIATKALLAFKNKPLFGWGWANFDYAFESVDWPIKFQDDIYVDKAHSHFLEVLVTTGVVGFGIYLLIIVFVISSLIKSKNLHLNYLLAAFILFIIHSQTNVISISEEIVFWVTLGITGALEKL